MSGDQIAGVVAIMAMLLLVVNGLARDPTPRHKMLRMVLLWAAIVAVIAVVVIALKSAT